MTDPRKTECLDCGCGTQEHMLRFDLDTWSDDPPDLYASIYLNQFRPWWRRIIPAIRYLFNLKPARCGYGHWDTWIMQRDDAARLKALLTEFQQRYDDWINRIVDRAV